MSAIGRASQETAVSGSVSKHLLASTIVSGFGDCIWGRSLGRAVSGWPLTKEHTRYALIDKWILAQKFGMPKIQFTDHMKLKKKEDHNVDTSVLLRRGIKIPMRGDRETKCGVPSGDPSHI